MTRSDNRSAFQCGSSFYCEAYADADHFKFNNSDLFFLYYPDKTEKIKMKITHHYKSLLSAIISVALFYSAAPHADILDGGEIQFNGFVSDEAPKWTWQISSPD